MSGPDIDGRIERRNLSNPRAFGNLALVLSLVLALLAGAAVGVGLVGFQDVQGDSVFENYDAQLEILESGIENLRERFSLRIENIEGEIEILGKELNRLIETSEEEKDDWPVDEIYKEVRSSVVLIKSKKTTVGFWGPTEQTSQGSGFIYGDSGYILTNHHVVEDADSLLVKFWEGKTVEATLVASDPYSDVGVVKVEPSDLDFEIEPLQMADSSELEPGDRVIAIGNPYGLAGTTTTGIVSQTGRVLNTKTGYPIPGVIQIDAAINPGNSGGPLLGFDGNVIGINTAIESQTGSFSGIGFAVPSNIVAKVGSSLIEEGRYNHPWIGVTGQGISYEQANEMGLKDTRGFLISGILPGSPASDAGLKKGDIILNVEGNKVEDIEDILSYIELNRSPGDVVNFEIFRNGEQISLSLRLGTRPSPD